MKPILNFLALFFCVQVLSQSHIQDLNGLNALSEHQLQFTSLKVPDEQSSINDFMKSEFGLSVNMEFKLSGKPITDRQNYEGKRFQQFYKGIPVEFTTITTVSRNGQLKRLNKDILDIKDMDVTPAISGDAAREKALEWVSAEFYAWESSDFELLLKEMKNDEKASYYPKAELVIIDKNLLKESGVAVPTLAYKFPIYALNPLSNSNYYIDAKTGDRIHKEEIMHHVEGPAATRNLGLRNIETEQFGAGYRLRDYSKGNGIITLNGDGNSSITDAVDLIDADNNWTAIEYDNASNDNIILEAHWAAMQTYDFFLERFNRNSLDDNGKQLRSYVNISSELFASWDGNNAVFGIGNTNPWATFDVVVHEFAHGLNQHTSQLSGGKTESGAINEGLSDIWAACITHFDDPSEDVWVQSEYADPGTQRFLSSPGSAFYPMPSTYLGTNWIPYDNDPLGRLPHHNSSILSLWFYYLSEGSGIIVNDLGNSVEIPQGVGIETAADILYRAQTMEFTGSMIYPHVRIYTINAAEDLFGEGSIEAITVANAWYAVGVGDLVGAYIEGDDFVCHGSQETYDITKFNPFVDAVNWEVSANLQIVNQDNESITVEVLNNGIRDDGYIRANYEGQQYEKLVWVGAPATPSSNIQGPSVVHSGALIGYNGSDVDGASAFQWYLPFPFDDPGIVVPNPTNWGIINGGSTRNVSVISGQNDGLIQFMGTNPCGVGGAKSKQVAIHQPGGNGGGIIKSPPGGGIPFQLNPDDIKDVVVYPNPTNGDFSIFTNSELTNEITIFDIDGKAIKKLYSSGKLTNLAIPDHLETGSYFIRIDGEIQVTKPILFRGK